MIKKILLMFLTISVVFTITGMISEVFSESKFKCIEKPFNKENRGQYIKNEFDDIKDVFFTKAEKIREGSLVSHFIRKDDVNKYLTKSYYLTVNVNHYVPQYIISIWARKEIKRGDIIEWYEEGIFLDQFTKKYNYKINRGFIYEIGNEYKEKNLRPVRIWDDVILKLFNKSNYYKKVYNEIDTNNEIENSINYIKKSFNSLSKKFFKKAENINEGITSCYYISININNTTYYILVYTEGCPIKIITSVWTRKEVELGSGIVEIYEEGIYKDVLESEYYYSITHKILYRNNNCRVKRLKPIKIWNEVINILSEKLNK